jgi:hypothetical protein
MIDGLKQDIKFNCDVSDARYWGYFSICGLLLRYRDLYRSEQGLKPWASIANEEITAWIQAKEARWPELENQDFQQLTIAGKRYDPFDVDAVNKALKPEGLVYGAGYGMYMKPTFFLAQLKSNRRDAGLTVHISGTELVRDLLTAPAMLQEATIFLRLEPLLILLHFKYSELNARRNSMLEDGFARYGFHARQLIDDIFEKRLQGLAERYAELIILHEIAEHKEGVPEWKEILADAGDRKNEHYLRALKDLIADTSEAGPLKQIIETRDHGALALSVALMEGFHRLLFPEIRTVYKDFTGHGDWGAVEQTRTQGYLRFIAARARILQLYGETRGKENFSSRLRAFVE